MKISSVPMFQFDRHHLLLLKTKVMMWNREENRLCIAFDFINQHPDYLSKEPKEQAIYLVFRREETTLFYAGEGKFGQNGILLDEVSVEEKELTPFVKGVIHSPVLIHHLQAMRDRFKDLPHRPQAYEEWSELISYFNRTDLNIEATDDYRAELRQKRLPSLFR